MRKTDLAMVQSRRRSFPGFDGSVVIPAPVGLGRDTPKRRIAREALARVLWSASGQRRLPSFNELAAALSQCDARDVFWVCEMNSYGPVYLLPTREWVSALVRKLQALGVKRVLEVAAGDGFVSACLRRRNPSFEIHTTDDASWSDPKARMTRQEARELRDVDVPGLRLGEHVERREAVSAVRKYRPDLVLVSWAPPGTLVERVIRERLSYVLDIGVDGDVCGNGMKTWRYNKEFLEGAVENRALCRLDTGGEAPQTRVTLYYGRGHTEFAED